MNDMTTTIIRKGEELAVLKNTSRTTIGNQGVLFSSYIDDDGYERDEAWVISMYAIVRWSDCGVLDYPQDFPFFSYATGQFEKNETSFESVDKLRRIFAENTRKFTTRGVDEGLADIVPIPVNNLANRIARTFDGERIKKLERSRTIIKNNNGFVFERELILCYDGRNDLFYHPEIPVAEFYPHPSSNLSGPFRDGMMYRTEIISEKSDTVGLIDVRSEYFKGIEIGIHEVIEGTYFPESERDVIDFSRYEPDRVLQYKYPFEPPSGGYRFDPVHIETPTLFYVLRIMEGFRFMDLYVTTKKETRPVLFVGVKTEDMKDFPLIEALVGPLRPEIRGYHL